MYRRIFLSHCTLLFQVLGQTLSRLARRQVAEAWMAELKAREHESRLLEELEVSGPALPGYLSCVCSLRDCCFLLVVGLTAQCRQQVLWQSI